MVSAIRELEQPGVIMLLLAVYASGGRTLERSLAHATLGLTQRELNSAVEKLIELKLARRVPSKMLPRTGDLDLTERGRAVASRLAEIQLFLNE
jgi:helix-turn-helix protein